jgi:hypothetical protein
MYEIPFDSNKGVACCPICNLTYVGVNPLFPEIELRKFFEEYKCYFKYKNIIEHSKKLAGTIVQAKNYLKEDDKEAPWVTPYPPMRAILTSLIKAEHFVHFVSYGMNEMFFGCLKMISQNIPVRGIISNATPELIEDYKRYNNIESPNLKLRFYSQGYNWQESAHQKLIIIDGLVAFKGSANLTKNGWRKALQGKEIIEYLTTVNDVVEYNNQYFSREWASFKKRDNMEVNIKEPYSSGIFLDAVATMSKS